MHERVRRELRRREPPPDGEHTHLRERLVVAEERGRFQPLADELVGTVVSDGQLIGVVEHRGGSHPIVTRFRGRMMGMLVHPGELVHEGAAIAWLQLTDERQVQ